MNKKSTSFRAVCTTLLTMLSTAVYASEAYMPYRSVKTAPALPNNNILAVCEDEDGFIWICSQESIARYDGFQTIPIEENVLSAILTDGGRITAMNSCGKWLLIGTRAGVWLYDTTNHRIRKTTCCSDQTIFDIAVKENRAFALTTRELMIFDSRSERCFSRKLFGKNFNSNRNSILTITSDGNIVVSCRNRTLLYSTPEGLCQSNMDSCRIQTDTLLTLRTPARSVIDKWGNLWVFDLNGLYLYKARSDKRYENPTVIIADTEISTLYHTPSGDHTWIGLRGKGNVVLSRGTDGRILSKQTLRVNESTEDLGNTTNQFFLNKEQILFTATRNGLYCTIYKRQSPFKIVRSESGNSNSLSHNTVTGVTCGLDNTVWLGTSAGLNKVTWQADSTLKITQYYDRRNSSHRIQSNKIEVIVEDNNGILWLGTKNKITFFDPRKSIYFDDEELTRPVDKCSFVRCMYKAPNGDIFIGFESSGLFHYDHAKRAIESIGSINDACLSICMDRQGQVWVGTRHNGIIRLDQDLRQVETIPLISEQGTNDAVNEIYCDATNNIWIGTAHGLYYYDRQFHHCQKSNLDYVDNQVYISGIIGDNYGNLWLSSLQGLYKYSVIKNTSSYFEIDDNEFVRPEYVFNCAAGQNGTLYFGGVNGMTYFEPEKIRTDSTYIPLRFTNFSILDNRVEVGSDKLRQDINHTNQITLRHNDYQFSLEFAALTYAGQYKIKYRYCLKGLDDKWFYTDADRRYVSYNNLSAGHYEFIVESTNASGIWVGNGKRIELIVQPSRWFSWWAIISILLITSIIVYTIYRLWIKWTGMKRREENYNWRMNFYTNISYGFRTPMTLLQAPLSMLLENYDTLNDSSKRELLETMHRNCKRLSKRIDRLLEFRQIEIGESTLKLIESDIVSVIENECSIMRTIFEKSSVSLKFSSNVSFARLVFDEEKIETILFNLLANALQNHSEGDTVEVKCTLDSNCYLFRISISGIRVFNRKSEQESNRQRFDEMTFSLTQSYIEMLKGSIEIGESDPDGRSTYSFALQLGTSHFDGVKIESPTHSSHAVNTPADSRLGELYDNGAAGRTQELRDKLKPNILLIGKDNETAIFIRKLFASEFNTIIRKRTESLRKEIDKFQSDLIILDTDTAGQKAYMEMCAKLKSNENCKHIPIVILCENGDETERKSWYQHDVDACVSKPFDADYLTARVKQLLQMKRNITAAAQKEIMITPQKVRIRSENDRFLARCMAVIEKNIDNEHFSADDFAEQMNINSSLLYRRIRSLTNMSPMRLVHTSRMKRAAQLLQDGSYTISEVAYKVGFSDTRYFSTCFKKEFDTIPTEYRRKNKENFTNKESQNGKTSNTKNSTDN